MSIFPSNPSVNDEFSGYRWDGEAWKVIGVDLNADYATTSELSAHELDSTNVHGISDTNVLATENYVDTELSSHSSETTNVHGILDTSSLVIGSGITEIVALTQAQYDALTPDPNTLYVVTD